MFVSLFLCLFSTLCILCFCIVLCIASPFVYSSFFPIFAQVYLPLPPGGSPIAVNKYHISYHTGTFHREMEPGAVEASAGCPVREKDAALVPSPIGFPDVGQVDGSLPVRRVGRH